jgi:F-type H+-transporting ATPase subunit f
MHASLIRRNLSGLVPPKIASPSILVSQPRYFINHSFSNAIHRFFFFFYPHAHHKSAGKGSDLSPLVAFYSKLPKGPASEPAVRGIKARYFNGKNASASPIVFTVLALFGLGYTIDYQSEFWRWPAALLIALLLLTSCIRHRFYFFQCT